MRIGRIVARLENDGIMRCETRQRVDVRIGVVAFEIAVIEPQHASAPNASASSRVISSRVISGWR